MHCPSCLIDLQITERQGIAIDYCPKCRGVWLDRGELDKIIERTVSQITPAGGAVAAASAPMNTGSAASLKADKKKKKSKLYKSILEEIFDF